MTVKNNIVVNHLRSCYYKLKHNHYLKLLKNKNSFVSKKATLIDPLIENDCGVNDYTFFSNSRLGHHSRIAKYCSIDFCYIESFSSIAANVSVGIGNHPINTVSSSMIFYRKKWFYKDNDIFSYENIANHEPIHDKYRNYVGNDVWIGLNAIIKQGIKIGDGAVIGAGAVVTKDVPPYAIVGGVPAKVIKYRFNEQQINQLLRIKWWNWPIELIKERKNDFANIDDFIKKYGDNV